MNKNVIQKFAIWARNELIAQVSQRAYQYGIDESGFGDASADTLNGRLLTAEEKSQRQELIKQIKEKGYQQVMEEVAYTWFNRFIALRFMEVNNYLPSHIRVFSDASGAFKPEILNDVLHLDLPGLDSGKVAEYIESNDTEALYRYLLLTQCNALNSALPVMFERMGGYTEMLLPNNILRQDSVLGHMVSDIPEEDWQDAVQIIGWLYQYYNTELKDDTFAQLKKNVKITKERIPAATQLFTPDWIVRYMVENSLGRLWLEGHPNAELRGGWKYYLDEAEQEPEVEAQLTKLREDYKTINHELAAYAPELAERPQVVVANKCDMPGTSEALEALRQCAAADGHAFFAVSAVTGAGIDSLEAACAEMVSKLRAERELDDEPLRNDVWEQRRIRRDNAISISNLGGGVWRVSGKAIERMVIKTDWENEEAVAYLQHRFDRLGLDKALAKAGCVTGDTVRILGYDLDYAGDDEADDFAELMEDEPVITVGEIALDDEPVEESAPDSVDGAAVAEDASSVEGE